MYISVNDVELCQSYNNNKRKIDKIRILTKSSDNFAAGIRLHFLYSSMFHIERCSIQRSICYFSYEIISFVLL